MVKEILSSILTHGKPIYTGKNHANMRCSLMGECKFIIAGEERL